MPTKLQIIKNLKLSQRLLDYLSKNPDEGKNSNVSYIVITEGDSELNKANISMAKSLVKEGKQIIKAIQTKDKTVPWKFASI